MEVHLDTKRVHRELCALHRGLSSTFGEQVRLKEQCFDEETKTLEFCLNIDSGEIRSRK